MLSFILLFFFIIVLANLWILITVFLFRIPSPQALTLHTTQDVSLFTEQNYLFEKLHHELNNLKFDSIAIFCIKQRKSQVHLILYRNIDKNIYCNVYLANSKPYSYEFLFITNANELSSLFISDLSMKFLHPHREFNQIAFSSKYSSSQLYEAFLAKIEHIHSKSEKSQFEELEAIEMIKYFWEKDIQSYIKQNIIESNCYDNSYKLTQHGKSQYFLKLAYPLSSLYIHKVSREAKTFLNLK
ncbi:hypothetical protein [Acinetobacter dispersus]|uniref:Uncharacterized protein n=1 Tax=Acinetobacter dispersus TaxID=70348 RepID=N9LMD9_9GAMM|nr:hypothetical protein [Acinetobacter dispersus]ENW97427.1 hypothetical protein F904_00265 [Acinetobacter dispersus]